MMFPCPSADINEEEREETNHEPPTNDDHNHNIRGVVAAKNDARLPAAAATTADWLYS